jgi:hypothetical protein
MANPFGITEVDIPGILGAYHQRQQQDFQSRLLGRKMEREDEALATRKRVGALAGTGDLAGAKREAATSGDFDLFDSLGKMDESQRKTVKERAGTLASVALAAKSRPYAARKAFIAQSAPTLKALGYTDEQLAQFDPTDDAIDAVAAEASDVDKAIDAAKDPETIRLLKAAGVKPGTPEFREAVLGHVNPSQFMEFGSDASGRQLIQTRGMTGGGGPASGAGASGGTVALEGNNPGGIIDSDFARSQPGYQGPNGRFAKFGSIADGENAQRALLRSYIERGYDTPAKIAQRWAPAGDGANNPVQYAQNVANALGIGINDRLAASDVDRFQFAQAKQENAMYQGSGGGQSGPRVIASTPPVPKQPKFQAPRLTAAEVAAEGLAPGVYYRNESGIPQRVDKDGDKADAPYSQSAIDAFNRAIETAGRLKTHPGLSTAVGAKGLTGGLIGGWVVPGTDAADFVANLDTMKAQVFLPMVQSMKGMGALSNAEGQKLTDAIGALDPKQSEASFKASLDRIVGDLTTYRDRGAPKSGGTVRVNTPAEARALKPGTKFITPDGRTGTR